MIVCRLTRTQKCTYNGKNHQIKGFPYSADLNMKDEIKGIEQTCDKMFYFCLFIRGNRA